jgi:hypothetical protein
LVKVATFQNDSSPSKDADQLQHVHRVNAVALAALNDLELQKVQGKLGTAVERTTLLIRSVQKVVSCNHRCTQGEGREGGEGREEVST